MTDLFLDRSGVTSIYDAESWQRVLFAELEAQMTSDARPFPCVYGVAGFKHDNLRFCFLDEIGPETLGPILEDYLPQARSNGRNASLVVFERPAPVQRLEDYRDRFWGLLDGLASRDKAPWPTDIPQKVNDPEWEFCYANEPIFVVCNTPAHVQRQSRRSTGFMVTLQPRWVFDGITDTENKAATAFGNVRQRLRTFDLLPPSPALGRYGDKGVFEFAQYFIGDENTAPTCPMARLSGPAAPQEPHQLETLG